MLLFAIYFLPALAYIWFLIYQNRCKSANVMVYFVAASRIGIIPHLFVNRMLKLRLTCTVQDTDGMCTRREFCKLFTEYSAIFYIRIERVKDIMHLLFKKEIFTGQNFNLHLLIKRRIIFSFCTSFNKVI